MEMEKFIFLMKNEDFLSMEEIANQKTFNIDYLDHDRNTFLQIAIKRQFSFKVIEFLLERGCNPNIINNWGYTALSLSLFYLFKTNNSYYFHVFVAIVNGKKANLDSSYSKYPNDEPILHTMILTYDEDGDGEDIDLDVYIIKMFDLLLENNVNVNSIYNGSAPIHYSNILNEYLIKRLINKGAIVNVEDSRGNTPIFLQKLKILIS